ncbi:MAG: hypothetical protein Q7S40_02560 [Opitutaceae bacterium]|nr:hypothetical protein [Opitutaceae bacterium]
MLHEIVKHFDRLLLVALFLITHRQPILRLRDDAAVGSGLGGDLFVDLDCGIEVLLDLLGVDALLQKGGR